MRENRQLTKAKNAKNDDIFVYNVRGEVAFAEIAGNAEEHDYNLSGNSLWSSFNSDTNHYSVNNLNQYSSISTLCVSAPPCEIVLHADNNGNVTHYCDENGTVVASYTYDAFGRTISQSGPMSDTFRHRFSTKYHDPETGLYYYGYRFYSPVLKRWLNRDPIEEDGGMNLYAMCGNNSLMDHYDSYGQKPASQCVKYSVKSNKLSEKEVTWVNFPTLQW